MNEYAVNIKSLTKKYKDTIAVNNLNLEIANGELYSLLGVNGAGKSTTIKMLCGLSKPTSGDAFLLGKSINSDLAEVKELIGISPQETAVAPNLTVKENLELMCGSYGFGKIQTKEKIREMLEKFSFEKISEKKAGKLSGGWQRKLSIAMALIGEPKILFLDEPTLGLDVISRSELWDMIRSLKGRITIVLTTHYMEEAEALSSRIGIMKDGVLIAAGTADELKEKAGTEKFEDAFIKLVKEAKI